MIGYKYIDHDMVNTILNTQLSQTGHILVRERFLIERKGVGGGGC